jgi:hypothetical protein
MFDNAMVSVNVTGIDKYLTTEGKSPYSFAVARFTDIRAANPELTTIFWTRPSGRQSAAARMPR